MTNEEKQHIRECRIMIVGIREFIPYIKEELSKLGFSDIADVAICEVATTEESIIIDGERYQ